MKDLRQSTKQMTNRGLVTIVIPCYNQAHFLSEALESIIRQTYRNFEIVVVNDGSTDNTGEVALTFPHVSLVNQENCGLGMSRNNGLKAATGEFVVFMDADDKLLPNALEIGVQTLDNKPECAFASGFCERVSYDGEHLPTMQPIVDESDYYRALVRSNFIWAPSNVMYRRQIFDKIAGFIPELSPAADYEIYLRIARQFPIYHHSFIITEYRQHKTSMSKNFALMLEHVTAVLKMQKEFVKGNKWYEEALRESIASYRYFYLEGVAGQLLTSKRNGEWLDALRKAAFLLRFPTVLPKLITTLVREKLES